ncbi:MAG TPA: hypothetical protein VHS76_03150 [Steroidobacteraceae bacterium]|nr:hypothetical protein [Steroidobacteraceae bacterium]
MAEQAYAQQPSTADDSASSVEAAAAAAAIAKANAAAAKQATPAQSGKPEENKAFTKRAVLAGWRPEVQHGTTMYCREQPIVGSRFTKKLCGTQLQLALVLEQQEFERDQLKQRGCGGNCGGH